MIQEKSGLVGYAREQYENIYDRYLGGDHYRADISSADAMLAAGGGDCFAFTELLGFIMVGYRETETVGYVLSRAFGRSRGEPRGEFELGESPQTHAHAIVVPKDHSEIVVLDSAARQVEVKPFDEELANVLNQGDSYLYSWATVNWPKPTLKQKMVVQVGDKFAWPEGSLNHLVTMPHPIGVVAMKQLIELKTLKLDDRDTFNKTRAAMEEVPILPRRQ